MIAAKEELEALKDSIKLWQTRPHWSTDVYGVASMDAINKLQDAVVFLLSQFVTINESLENVKKKKAAPKEKGVKKLKKKAKK